MASLPPDYGEKRGGRRRSLSALRRRSSGPTGDANCITVSVSVDERNDSPAGSATLTVGLHLVVGEKPTKTKRGNNLWLDELNVAARLRSLVLATERTNLEIGLNFKGGVCNILRL